MALIKYPDNKSFAKDINGREIRIGYKAFYKGLKAYNEFQYEVDKIIEQSGKLELCANGLHFCWNPAWVFNYYKIDDNHKYNDYEYGIVEILGDIINGFAKSITNKMRILKIVTIDEFFLSFSDGFYKVPDNDKEKSKQYFSQDCALYAKSDLGFFTKNGKVLIERDKDDQNLTIYPDGTKCWLKYGQYHRENDMPAYISPNGHAEWWTSGKMIKESMVI